MVATPPSQPAVLSPQDHSEGRDAGGWASLVLLRRWRRPMCPTMAWDPHPTPRDLWPLHQPPYSAQRHALHQQHQRPHLLGMPLLLAEFNLLVAIQGKLTASIRCVSLTHQAFCPAHHRISFNLPKELFEVDIYFLYCFDVMVKRSL